jgi:hypothetical protein
MANDLVYRLRERARIRRAIQTRKSAQEGKPDRIADLLDEAATEIEMLLAEIPVAEQRGFLRCQSSDSADRQLGYRGEEVELNYEGQLYGADPDCQHEVYDAFWEGGGVKCRKCRGWY